MRWPQLQTGKKIARAALRKTADQEVQSFDGVQPFGLAYNGESLVWYFGYTGEEADQNPVGRMVKVWHKHHAWSFIFSGWPEKGRYLQSRQDHRYLGGVADAEVVGAEI